MDLNPVHFDSFRLEECEKSVYRKRMEIIGSILGFKINYLRDILRINILNLRDETQSSD